MSDTPAIVTQASTLAAEVEAAVAKLNAERSAAWKAAIFEFGTRAVYFTIGAVVGIVFAHFV
jgi:uncharacterized membrane protein